MKIFTSKLEREAAEYKKFCDKYSYRYCDVKAIVLFFETKATFKKAVAHQ